MERFFWSLKHEWTNHEQYRNLEYARVSVFQYVKTFCNSERLYLTLEATFQADYAPASA